jgi:DNA (cytosine-5)-methyltransferase 1
MKTTDAMNGMTVCSGIGAPERAAPWIDWRWQSEIEPFPCSVLRHRFPDATNLGDMTKFQEWPDATVDVLCGGTPCQSFSVAGLRKGLADPRGNLMLTYLAIADRFRPRWIVWENVPGVLSSNGGRDFGSFLGGLGQLGYGFAYRVLDAQFVRSRSHPRAVPQRRRRVFVVGYLGDWRRAAAVLFDAESMSGNPPPRREAGKGASQRPRISPAISSGHGWWAESDVGATVRAQDSITKADTLIAANSGHVGYCLTASAQQSLDAETETLIAVANDHPWAVRRLTPTECERLQGFPDGWTDVPHRGKPAADGPRYKALGNSWAVNCGEWLFDRIREVDAAADQWAGSAKEQSKQRG